jgi:hypothetical protein
MNGCPYVIGAGITATVRGAGIGRNSAEEEGSIWSVMLPKPAAWGVALAVLAWEAPGTPGEGASSRGRERRNIWGENG